MLSLVGRAPLARLQIQHGSVPLTAEVKSGNNPIESTTLGLVSSPHYRPDDPNPPVPRWLSLRSPSTHSTGVYCATTICAIRSPAVIW